MYGRVNKMGLGNGPLGFSYKLNFSKYMKSTNIGLILRGIKQPCHIIAE
jgi:hypothetical protein